MANYRNEYEFRSGLLDALGVEHTEADAKNEERWRAKMLDGLEVEYNQNDVNQFDLFRAKLVEGVEAKAEGGGGGSSDFSTAQVTIVGTENNVMFPLPALYEAQDELPAVLAVENVSAQNSTYTVPLYNGICDVTIWGATSVQCTGNAEYDDAFVHITGDCTITIS